MAVVAMPERLLAEVEAEVRRQDVEHPGGYGSTRDGVRLGVASMEDEVREALEAWGEEKGNGSWPATRAEVVQVVAVGLRLLRSLPGA